MRVAIFHEILIKLGGAERVVKVLADMFEDADIFTLLYDEAKCGQTFDKKRVKTSKLQKWYNLKMPFNYLRTKMPQAVEEFDFSDYDLVISSSSAFVHSAVTNTSTKHLCYCHSPARFMWDWYFQVLKEQEERSIFPMMKKFFISKTMHHMRLWDRASADRPDKILANSLTVQKRINKFWSQDAEIVYPPVDVDKFQLTENNEGYFFIVSTLSPYKKIDVAVKAFNRIPKHKLIVIGDGSQREYLKNLAGKNVEILGRKSDEVVREYMQNCRAFIFPGLEDFGMTPVEAMACGKPVIALNQGGVKESVIADKTGIFFDQSDEDSLLDAMVDFFNKEKDFNPNKIRERAMDFSRDKFEKRIIEEVKKILS